METAILLIQCPDKPGIVAKVSDLVFQHNANIIRSDQYSTDPNEGQYFMRLEFCFDEQQHQSQQLEQAFAGLAESLNATWSMHYRSTKPRMGILVSQHDHCLYDLLYHWQSGELVADIPFIISNHKTCEKLAAQYNIPFHYLPSSKETKAEQEQAILDLVTSQTDFLVLARYMQILSAAFLDHYANDIINIHHSFLPSFIGANPYQQAYNRGVKIIGATAHYVTANLDEGPIIEQCVERVTLHDNPRSLKRKGKSIENLTLLKAVEAHLDHRVIRFGNKTFVFT